MNKKLPGMMLMLLLSAWSSCLWSQDNLEQRLEQLEQRVEVLEQRLNALSGKPGESVAGTPEEKPDAGAGDQAVSLVLEDWSYRQVQVKFNTYYALDLTLRNGYDKTIMEMEARLQFRSLLGSHLYSITLPSNIRIPPGASVVNEGDRQNKRLLGKGHPMLKHAKDEISAELILQKLVFNDGGVVTF